MLNEKEYLVDIRLGLTTDTYDALGKTIAEKLPSNIFLKNIEDALSSFQGEIFQVPPMFSALKHKGVRLYNLCLLYTSQSPRDRQKSGVPGYGLKKK